MIKKYQILLETFLFKWWVKVDLVWARSWLQSCNFLLLIKASNQKVRFKKVSGTPNFMRNF